MIAAGIDFSEQGDGPPIVCLHGIGGGKESFCDQLQGLNGYRMIAWDMPGYGDSDTRPLTFAGLSEALANLIDALGLKSAHLLGHSIGGMVAIEHAMRRPDHVRSLALIGTTSRFGGRDEGFKETFLKARLAPLDAGQTMVEMAALAAPNIVGSVADKASVKKIETVMAKVPASTWRNILACLVTFDRHNDLGAIDVPTCLIAGSEDQNAPARTMQKMAAKFAHAEYHEIVGAGHMINQEAPDQVNAVLNAFYGKMAR